MKILKTHACGDGTVYYDVELTEAEVLLVKHGAMPDTSVAAATKASDSQVDGDHYKTMGDAQPWDVLAKWLTPEEYRGYQKGVAIGYLAREQAKGGDSDIRKAAHHLQRLIEEFKPAVKEVTSAEDGTWSIRKDGSFTAADIKPVDGYTQRIADPAVQDEIVRGLATFIAYAHGIAQEAGWWVLDGKDVRDHPQFIRKLWEGTKLGLITTEVSEAIEGHRKNVRDDHLPQWRMWMVELGDVMIRSGDFAGGLASPYSLARATVDKMVYNTQRADHKPEARNQTGGKEY